MPSADSPTAAIPLTIKPHEEGCKADERGNYYKFKTADRELWLWLRDDGRTLGGTIYGVNSIADIIAFEIVGSPIPVRCADESLVASPNPVQVNQMPLPAPALPPAIAPNVKCAMNLVGEWITDTGGSRTDPRLPVTLLIEKQWPNPYGNGLELVSGRLTGLDLNLRIEGNVGDDLYASLQGFTEEGLDWAIMRLQVNPRGGTMGGHIEFNRGGPTFPVGIIRPPANPCYSWVTWHERRH